MGDSQTLLGDEVFEDDGINDIVRRLEIARENARQRSRETAEERRVYEDFIRQHREASLRPPSEGPGGLPQDPRGQHGERLGLAAARILQGVRLQEAQRQEQAAHDEVRELEQELTSEAQSRF